MSRPSKKRRAAAVRTAGTARGDAPAPRVSRAELRNEQARAALEPLAPGERPVAVTVGALIAFALALANLSFFAAGAKVGGERPQVTVLIVFSGLMLAVGGGMWQRRYGAVLAMQAILALAILIFAVLLTIAENVVAAVVCLAVIGIAGTLFWFLIRAMARMQIPKERP